MANFAGALLHEDLFGLSTDVDAARSLEPIQRPFLLDDGGIAGTFSDEGQKSDKARKFNFTGDTPRTLNATVDWFETFHVIPRKFEFGNLLSQVDTPIEVYSAYRTTNQFWNAFLNNAGAGVTLVGQPALPREFTPQSGLVMTLRVEASGEANVDTTLDFVFGDGTASVPITLQRIVGFALRPESGYRETLEWLTEIISHDDETEQRISLREVPRQFFEWQIIFDDGRERSFVESLMFDFQQRVYGVPVWHEMTRLASPSVAGDSTISVQTTDFRDFREGSLVMIYEGTFESEVATILTGGIGATTLTFDSPLLNPHTVNTIVIPVRTAVVDGAVRGRRYPSGSQELTLRFRVEDNGSSIADTSNFSEFDGKVLADDCNLLDGGTLSETFTQELTIVDNETGRVFQVSGSQSNRRRHGKVFYAQDLEQLYHIKQLLYALRGRQVSFYIPTFAKDLTPLEDILTSGTDLVVENIGYANFIRNRQPRNVIRVTFNDGSLPVLRTIVGSDEDDTDRETLTVSPPWGSNIDRTTIERISFVEKVRLDADSIRIDHHIGERSARVITTVRDVFE